MRSRTARRLFGLMWMACVASVSISNGDWRREGGACPANRMVHDFGLIANAPSGGVHTCEEEGRRHEAALRRGVCRLIGSAARSTNACSPASNDIATPSSKLRPTRARATTRFRDATASPGHGFSFASDHKSVDILRPINKLYRIVRIHTEPQGVSRAKTHKLVFRHSTGGRIRNVTLRSHSKARCLSRRKDSVCSSTY